MTGDPYRILGVSRDATDAQIKSAYRDLARRHHPDNYPDPERRARAEERMKEINEAYGIIRRMRAQGGAGAEFHAHSRERRSDTDGQYAEILERARDNVRAERFDEAEAQLNAIPPEMRGAEWNFLKGCVLTHKGWYFDAGRHLETACYMDPENGEYREFLESIRASASTYGRGYRTDAPGGRSDLCDICASFVCLDCLCECCGGDLIRCC